jgi:hypothetical protein
VNRAGADHRVLARGSSNREVKLNLHSRLWVDRLTEGLADTGSDCRLLSGSYDWLRITSARRSILAILGSRQNFPKP